MAGRIVRNSPREILAQKRIGASIIRSGWHIKMRLNKAKWPWPLGKVTLYRDRLEIKALVFSPLVLSVKEINSITSTLGRVRVKHTNQQIPDYISLFGFGLYDTLKNAVRQSGLDIPFS
jgi:hypothetical protein